MTVIDCKTCPARHGAIYSGVSDARLNDLAGLRQGVASFGPDQTILANERDSDFAFTLKAGWVYRRAALRNGRTHILGFYTEGACLTLRTLAKLESDISVRSLTPVVLCRFPRDAMMRFLDSDPGLRLGVFRYILEAHQRCEWRQLELGSARLEEALASLILWFAGFSTARTLRNGLEAILFPLKLPHIAAALGVTEIHAGRVVRALEEQRLILREKGGLLWIDKPRLRDIAPEIMEQRGR